MIENTTLFFFWARHVKDFLLDNCSISAEQKDGRYAVVLDDVIGGEIKNLKVKEGITDKENVKVLRSKDIDIQK